MLKINDNLILFRDQKQLIARITDPVHKKDIQAVPGIQLMDSTDGLYVQLPWCEHACQILNNIGIDATEAAPCMYHEYHPLVEGKYTPMKHQIFTAAFITLNPRAYILSDPRTGKTGALILGTDYLRKNRSVIGGWLIITTVTTISSVWASSIRASLPHAKVTIVHGKDREKALNIPSDYYITNYDSCRISTKAFIHAVQEGRIGGVVIDEMTHIGNSSSKRHKAIDAFTNRLNMEHVIGITGSPGENPETVYGMCRMINRSKLPCQTKTSWMNLVTFQYGPEPFMRKMTAQAPAIIHSAMQPAVRFRKGDILDLPPITVQDRTCNLSAEQKRMREEFRAEAVALAKSGEVITAANGGVLAQKLLQIAKGVCITNQGEVVSLEHKDRTSVILEAIAETDRKVVVFETYKAVTRMLSQEIRNAGYTCEFIDGSVTDKARAEILYKFQNMPDPRVLVTNATCTAFGVELSAADTMIYNGPVMSGGFVYAQSLERLSSAKQTANNINIIRIIASPEEKKYFGMLDKGQESGRMIAALFEDFASGIL